MQNQIGFNRFGQRCMECGDQAMRQIANETDRIGQGRVNTGLDVELACGGIQRRKQMIGHVRVRSRHAVEQCRFARIGVTDNRDLVHPSTFAAGTLRAALAIESFQFFFEAANFIRHQPAIDFQLRFTRAAAYADATALAFQVGPALHQAR